MRKSLLISGITVLMLFAVNTHLAGEILFSSAYNWQAGQGTWASGIAWGDIDGNGWMDLATGVGIDVGASPDKIYFNYDGILSSTAGWISEYNDNSNMVQIGDLDNDGDLDMFVPSGAGVNYHPQVIYYNDNGLPVNPDWSSEPLLGWSGDLGDPDGDGDLDIVVADGSALMPKSVKIFYNTDGHFNTSPDWESDYAYKSIDAEFADIDLDGDLDLAITGLNEGVKIFYNHDGVLETTPSWSTMSVYGGPQIAFGDVDGDDYPELAVPGGVSGGFAVLRNVNGTYESIPMWTCNLYIASGVSWADVDADGDLDLAGCGWQNAPVGIFENVDGVLSSSYVWSVTVGGSPQLVAFADYDEDMLVETVRDFTSDGTRKLFALNEIPIHEISSVEVDGVPLEFSQYCYRLEGGWVSLASPPPSGSTISVHYVYSRDLDLAVGSNGAWIFNNQISTKYYPTYSFNSTEFVDDNEDGFFDAGETARFYFSLANQHAPDNNVTVTMTCSDPGVVFTNSSVFFPIIEGSGGTVDNLSAPIEYNVPDVETAVFDTFFITIESDLGLYRDSFTFIKEVGRTEILLVDDDGGASCENIFYEDLCRKNIPSHLWSTDARSAPAAEVLNQYRIVFWLTGAEGPDRLQAGDIDAMQAYLDAGGYLFLSGLGLAGELSVENPDFLQNYLHCSYSQDRFENIHYGMTGSIFGDLQLRLTTSQTVPGMEKILMQNGGQAALRFNNTSSSYSAVTFADYYRIVFMTWGYELISNDFTGDGYASRDEVLQQILDFFPSFICGDINDEGSVNILDIVYLVNSLYKNGPMPDPLISADVNSDGNVNILDIVYLINYIYKDGPEPNCP